MRKIPFGTGNPDVAFIGQGTWYIEQTPRNDAIRALNHGIDIGLNHIDTAEMYASGVAEEIVGEAIAGRREEVFLVSKVLPWNASHDGTIQACEESLSRLQTDHLDCYLLHWRGSFDLEETFSAMRTLRDAGKIRSFGVSNFDVNDLDEAATVLGDASELACNQVLYHLGERYAEHTVIPWCQTNGTAFVAYSPFGQGAFPTQGSGRSILDEIANNHGATARQVALAFLAHEDGVLLIPKAAKIDHLDDNRAAANLKLTADEIVAIDTAFPRGQSKSGLPML